MFPCWKAAEQGADLDEMRQRVQDSPLTFWNPLAVSEGSEVPSISLPYISGIFIILLGPRGFQSHPVELRGFHGTLKPPQVRPWADPWRSVHYGFHVFCYPLLDLKNLYNTRLKSSWPMAMCILLYALFIVKPAQESWTM